MIKKLMSLVMALFLMASFYLYALLQEDDESKRTDQWVVASSGDLSQAQEPFSSNNPAHLSAAMGISLPLPRELSSGEVKDSSYHGYRTRLLTAQGAGFSLSAVRPSSAAPTIRDAGLSFQTTGKTLMSFPLLRAEKDGSAYYYLSSEQMALMIHIPSGASEDDALSAFELTQP